MGQVGGYNLHLYCDGPGHPHRGFFAPGRHNAWPSPTEYDGDNLTQCLREARRDGWIFRRKGPGGAVPDNGWGWCLCPVCAKK
jgi:hypothetical protein